MKTFSAMSTPDMVLTRKSYLMNLVFINQLVSTDCFLSEDKVAKLKKEIFRLQILIEAIDGELLHE